MTDYTELVKVLRSCAENFGCPIECPRYSPADEGVRACVSRLEKDAAAAIEALQAEVLKLKERTKAQQGRLEDYMEKQLYIDHYGDKWMTSAKDVPTAAYNHGYMDGKNEAEQALEPKHGEWVEDTATYAGPGLSNYKCSLCGKICGTWRRGLKPSELPNWCGNCGADMREMEVQDEYHG